MSQSTLKLKKSCIISVPLDAYAKDFTFVVNGEEFRTSCLISDLISPKICQIHKTDPTFNKFVINTEHNGNFSRFLELLNFEDISLPDSEMPFFYEIIQILGNFNIKMINSSDHLPISNENIFQLLQQHNQCHFLYSKSITEEIDYISSHFYELCDTHNSQLKSLSYDMLYEIISNSKLLLKNEDQLIKFINELISDSSSEFTSLYELVIFSNANSSTMDEFVNLFDMIYLNRKIWERITDRLKLPVQQNMTEASQQRYLEKSLEVLDLQNWSNFNGIIKYLKNHSNGKIENELNVTAISFYDEFVPLNVTEFDDEKKWFRTNDGVDDNWICFDFKDKKVNLTKYEMKSIPFDQNLEHPKFWVVEGSNDKEKWKEIDSINNCQYLNGKNLTHIFNVNNSSSEAYRYIKIRQTGVNWRDTKYFMIGSVELYGKIIQN